MSRYAAIITDGQLEPLDEGISFVIHAEKALLDGMDEWYRHVAILPHFYLTDPLVRCTKQHGEVSSLSGLWNI